MIKRLGLVPAFACALLLGGAVGAYFRDEDNETRETGHAAQDISLMAQKLIQTLDDAQRAKAVLVYESAERFDWHFIPKPERKGLQLKEMTGPQREAAMALVRACLSDVGNTKATKIMEFEKVLQHLERDRQGGPLRDHERYYFTIFGDPGSTEQKWGLSIEGHHLSLNFVVQHESVVSCTPAVFASNPAEMMETVGEVEKGTRILADEELLAFELVKSLSPEQQKTALIAEKAPAEVRSAGEAQPPQTKLEGVLLSDMNGEQRELFSKLISTYTNNMHEELGRHRFEEINRSDPTQVAFAWAGPTKPGVGHYYKIQGPTFLIEFVNTQPDAAGNPANHIHSMWRDMRGDFGVPVQP